MEGGDWQQLAVSGHISVYSKGFLRFPKVSMTQRDLRNCFIKLPEIRGHSISVPRWYWDQRIQNI